MLLSWDLINFKQNTMVRERITCNKLLELDAATLTGGIDSTLKTDKESLLNDTNMGSTISPTEFIKIYISN